MQQRGYQYDCSTVPTFLGPVARAYFFVTARLDKQQERARKQLFGKFSEGFRTLRPFKWDSLGLDLIEIPVTTMPIIKVPIHLSYVCYLAVYSEALAITYFWMFLVLCRLLRIEPSLLHPLDFLGGDDEPDLAFFPAMNMKSEKKLRVSTKAIDMLRNRYEIVPMIEHNRVIRRRLDPLSE